jgi:hypothetical protein
MLKQLAKGEAIQYNQFSIRTEEGRIILRGEMDKGEVELHFNAVEGETFGLSMDQVKRVVTFRETPIFRTSVKKR